MNGVLTIRRTRPTIAAVKAHNPILDVARALGLDVRGHVARCIRAEAHTHGDRSPSLSFYRDRFKCFGCGLAGDVVDLVREVRGGAITDAAEWLAARAGLPWPTATPGKRRRSRKPKGGLAAPTPSGASDSPQAGEREITDGIRGLFARVRQARAVATAAGPDAESTWALLSDAARWELSAEHLAAELDDLRGAEQARGRHR